VTLNLAETSVAKKGMCDVSRDLEFWLQWNTDRKSYVTYRMAPVPMPLNDLEGHFFIWNLVKARIC